MALEQAIDFGGIPIPKAYHRIHGCQISGMDGKATLIIFTYLDKDAANSFKGPISVGEFELDYAKDGENISTQGYVAMKQGPDYQGAKDV